MPSVVRLLGCTIHINEPQTDAWTRYLVELMGRTKDLRPVFEKFGDYMVNGSLWRTFEAQGRPVPWPPLSPLYARRKAKRYPGARILERTGAMMGSWFWKATKQTLKIDNPRRYWRYHQKGSPKTHLPQRVIVILQNVDKGVLTRWTRQYLRTAEVTE
jgi:phage gpG-like protein